MTRIELWNGDICVLEVDAIVSPATPTLWMSTGIAGALKRAGGDSIEFAAVRQGPAAIGSAVVTPAGSLAASAIVHAVSLDSDRRTSASAIESAVRSAMARARQIGARSVAIPAMGTDVGGFPLEDSAALTVGTVRDELADSPDLEHVVFALRGLAAYEAFERALGLATADASLPEIPDPIGVPVRRPTSAGEAGA
jgi:O-acetyl-ADP-ribose deacetylase (regulator of RNase III)